LATDCQKRRYHRVTVNLTESESAGLAAASYLKNVSPASYVRNLIRKTTRAEVPKLRSEIKKASRA
jgi:hypothetical protein